MFYKMDKLEFARHFSETWDKDYKQGKGVYWGACYSAQINNRANSRCLVMKSAKFHISSPTKNSFLSLSNTGKYCWIVST